MMQYYEKLIDYIKQEKPSKEKLSKQKIRLCKLLKFKEVPTDIQVLLHAEVKDVKFLKDYLATKPVRTGSGVAVVAVMTKPMKCPHGRCAMCPGGPKSHFGRVPQSYTGLEPAVMRAKRNKYDPYLQIFNRLEQYIVLGQSPEKAELIIMGGTFPGYPKEYKDEFILYSYKAMNDFSGMFYKGGSFLVEKFKKFFELPGKVGNKARTKRIHEKLMKLKKNRGSAISSEQARNAKSAIKCVGLTIETRPDFGLLQNGHEMLKYGCTRVELGVQSVYDAALSRIERGHNTITSILSTRILKDLGFKINYHYMLGLPGVDRKRDIEGLKELFNNPDYRPDMLKIYPCMVLKGTKLYRDYKSLKFKPITTRAAMSIIAELKKDIPRYVRIMRVQRDIPTRATEAGVDRTNLRQLLHNELIRKGIKCGCIRCREIRNEPIKGPVFFDIIIYEASFGKEFFISLVNNDRIVGFARLRFPSGSFIKEIGQDSAIIRELHVYGTAEAIGAKGRVQHRGYGKRLLREAEKIARKYDKQKLVVISGVGVRGYYKKLGYALEGSYMVKKLIK